jgi:type II secretory pathway component HofQ
MRLFATFAPVDFVLEPGATGRIRFRAKDMSWDQALDGALRAAGLSKHEAGSGLWIVGPPSEVEAFRQRKLTGAYRGQLLSLDFSEADLRGLLGLFADVSGLAVEVDPGIEGPVGLKVQDLPWDRTLDVIVTSRGLSCAIENGKIHIRKRP